MPRPNRGASVKWIDKRQSYYIVWYEGGRERLRATGSADIREAETALAEFIRERRKSERAGPRDPHLVSVAEVLDLYGDQHAPTTADPARIAYAIDALLPFWGAVAVADITKDRCRAYVKARGKKPATVRRELGTMRAALNFAVTEKLIEQAPYVLLPPKPDGKDRWLSRSEAAALLNAARTARSDVRLYLPLFIMLGLYTGARKEAILSLRWPQVDFRKGQINFKATTDDDGAAVAVRRTNKRKSHIPIPRRLLRFLKLAKRRGTDLGYVVHDSGRQIKDIGDASNGSFGTACARAGLTDVSPHTLRHTCGTWLAQKGVSLFDIGQWLGHSDSRTTALYAHHSPDFQAGALAAMDRK